jgi:mRNA interferase MazF
MKPGEVVLIRFPQTNLHSGKLRPALVIAIAPGRYDDVLLALVSSRINQAIPNFDEIIH